MADPTSAQAFNRYMYVGNNPLMFTDPTGERRRLLENIRGEESIPDWAFNTWDSGIRMPQRNFWNYVNHYGEAVSNGYQGSQINFVNLCRDQSRQIGFNGEITFRYQYSYVDYSTSGVVSTANGYKSVSLPTIGVAAGKYTINLNDYGNNGGRGNDNNYSEFQTNIDSHQIRVGQPTGVDLDFGAAQDIIHASTYRVKGYLNMKKNKQNLWIVSLSLTAKTSDEEKDSYFAGVIFDLNGKKEVFSLYTDCSVIMNSGYIYLGSNNFILPNNGHINSIEIRAGYNVDEFFGHSKPLFYKQTFNF